MKSNRELTREFYKAFNSEHQNEVEEILGRTVIPEWKSYGSNDQFREGGRAAFVAILKNFHKVIPDLKWEIKELLEMENRIVVRSKVTGTPTGVFLGAKPTGNSFEMMTIDIHAMDKGEIIETFHIEDWMGAVKQFATQ